MSKCCTNINGGLFKMMFLWPAEASFENTSHEINALNDDVSFVSKFPGIITKP